MGLIKQYTLVTPGDFVTGSRLNAFFAGELDPWESVCLVQDVFDCHVLDDPDFPEKAKRIMWDYAVELEELGLVYAIRGRALQ